MRGPEELSVIELSLASSALWLELPPPASDPTHSLAWVQAYLQAGHGGRLLVAQRGERVIGRLQLHPTGALGLGMPSPRFAPGLSDDEITEIGDSLLRHVLARVAAEKAYRYLETDLAPTAPTPSAWRNTLLQHGFVLLSESRLFTCRATAFDDLPGAPMGPLKWMSASQLPSRLVESLYAAAYVGSLDRVHQHTIESTASHLNELVAYPNLLPDLSLWLIAFERGRAVGLVFTAMQSPLLGDQTTGWIVDLAAMPSARKRGIGGALLRRGVRMLAERGARCVLSQIDVLNVDSIRLHLRHGFEPAAETHQVLQKRL